VRVLPLLERVVLDQAPLAEGRELDVDIDLPPQTTTTLPESVLRCLLSNLVGNAIAHSLDGRVRIHGADGRLHIANAVPADAEAPSAGQRREGSPGLGLGLGIVGRLCERHGIVLTLRREGDQVIASFPLPPAP
jgi:signal transduction histidine kinase